MRGRKFEPPLATGNAAVAAPKGTVPTISGPAVRPTESVTFSEMASPGDETTEAAKLPSAATVTVMEEAVAVFFSSASKGGRPMMARDAPATAPLERIVI